MATKQARGTKRTCQSSECGARFYDLNRNPIVCPICGTVYELASSPLAIAAAGGEDKSARKARKADFAGEKGPADLPDVEGDELPEIEDSDEALAGDEDETFLEEEEEEGGDVATIIGPVDGEEEA